MRTLRIVSFTVGGLLLACGAGCGDKTAEGVTRLEPRGVPYLEGVAVPAGFSIASKKSTDFEMAGQRNAVHIYEGWGDPSAVRNFYREQMPLMGWARVSDQCMDGVSTLRFEKSKEACTVEIKPAMLNRTRIHVSVCPFTRATTTSEPPKRPVP